MSQLLYLPTDILLILLSTLEPISQTCFRCTCKQLNTLAVPIPKVQVDLKQLCDGMNTTLSTYKYTSHQIYTPIVYNHPTILPHVVLRFTKNKNGRCTFIIQNTATIALEYQVLQLVYEPEYERYRFIKLMSSSTQVMHVPTMLLYIGFKVIFQHHGYTFAPNFNHPAISLPKWLHRLLLWPSIVSFPDIIDGISEI